MGFWTHKWHHISRYGASIVSASEMYAIDDGLTEQRNRLASFVSSSFFSVNMIFLSNALA